MGDEDAQRPAHGTLTGDAGAVAPCAPLDMVRRLRARERGYLASLLHDGPIQELAAMALELGGLQTDESDGIAGRVDTAGRALSRLQDELWPFPRPGSGLVETLKRRTAWLDTSSLAVTADEGAAGLADADVQAVAEVVELMMAGLATEGAWDRPVVTIRADPNLIFIELNIAPAPGCDPARGGLAAVAWLRRLAAAIQARAEVGLDDGRLRTLVAIPRCLPHRGAGAGDNGGRTRKSGVPVDDHLFAGLLEGAPAERLELPAQREKLDSRPERDKLERQLQQSHRLESLGQLAGGIAHDFNNLLAIISSYAAFVGEEVAKDGPQVDLPSVRSDVGQIALATQRAAELTHHLLAFARREVVQLRPLDLNRVIARAEQLLIRTLGEHVILKTDLAPQLCAVLADPGQIEQVLVNLAVNARDAMPSGGTLVLQTSVIEIDESHSASRSGLPPSQYSCLKISDTGVGMPREVADRAFEPFFTTKPKGEGSGLGLATVYGIVAQARGYVQVYSEPGLGTTVTILLPATGRLVRDALTPEQEPGGAGETVLIVEDEPAMREVTRRILSRHGYEVITAASGAEAIDVAASYPGDIDVLLTDVVMPRMLGKEAAARIRSLRPGVKVLFMSGYPLGVLDSRGVVEADVNLIEKPFTEARLLATLRQITADGESGPES